MKGLSNDETWETLNVDLLRKTMDRVETVHAFAREGIEQNATWDQETWGTRNVRDGEVCNTRFCFAGWTCIEAGHEIVWVQHPWLIGVEIAKVRYAGRLEDISYTAQKLLGLRQEQAERVFDGDNSLRELRYEVSKLLGEDVPA